MYLRVLDLNLKVFEKIREATNGTALSRTFCNNELNSFINQLNFVIPWTELLYIKYVNTFLNNVNLFIHELNSFTNELNSFINELNTFINELNSFIYELNSYILYIWTLFLRNELNSFINELNSFYINELNCISIFFFEWIVC